MCGICGTIGVFEKTKREVIVREMNNAIIHRGPNEDGWYSDDVCTLAMRRLSIIDLAHGTQPKYDNAKTKLVFFNGEIYNYQELRNLLLSKGYHFDTNSDTEVIVNLYSAFGTAMFLMLKGMFAFCIYDIEKKEFLFARDRFGEKPLYYHQKEDGLIFSSEVRSLLLNPAVERVINKESLADYLKASYVPEPRTLLKQVYSLPPGNFMVFSKGHLSVNPYFKVDYTPDHKIKTKEDASDLIKPLFEKAVQRQMISEVPLGAFLSGGIDSSSIVAMMQLNSSKPVKTFNVKFEEASYDESPIAKEVAVKLGTEHHELVISNAEFKEEIFWKIIDHVGLPFPDSSAIPTWFITHEIKKHVSVALSGDGGDELFGGYPVFDWYTKIRKMQQLLPSAWSRSGAGMIRYAKKLPLMNSLSQLRQIEKGLSLASLHQNRLPVEIHTLFEDDAIYKLTGIKSDYTDLQQYPEDAEQWSDIRKIMYYRLKHNLPLDMLIKVDRMSMSNSLEVRAPFLDPDLFDASAKLPPQFLRKGGEGKLVIRDMMKDILPSSVFNHPKSGFSIPLHKYQNLEFENLVKDLFSENSAFSKLMNKETLDEIKQQGLNNKSSNSVISVYKSSHQLWSLLLLAGWMKRYNVEVER